jgi:DNA-binding MarR family transcriptional regulator
MACRAADLAEQTATAQDSDVLEYLLEDQVGHLLRRAHQRHTAIFQATIGDDQLTPLQFAALMKLADVDETSQNQLGRLTAMDAATMQGVIKRLIARGLILRRPDPDDRRRLPLTLRITDRTLEPLSPTERHNFLRLLCRLSD